jgi:hypothetical protein
MEPLFPKQHGTILRQWDHRVLHTECVLYPPRGPSVSAGRITLLSGCRRDRQCTVPSPAFLRSPGTSDAQRLEGGSKKSNYLQYQCFQLSLSGDWFHQSGSQLDSKCATFLSIVGKEDSFGGLSD